MRPHSHRPAAALLRPQNPQSVVPIAFRFLVTLTILIASNWQATLATADPSPEAIEFFENKIRPLLVEHCHSCHGPTTQWAGLRLDTRAGMLKGGDSGPAAVVGAADASELVRRILSDDEFEQMPPPESDKQLDDASIRLLQHWLDSGAAWPESDLPPADMQTITKSHWAFQPLSDPTPPTVEDATWGQSPVDAFVFDQLQASGLQPSPATDRRTLIRRVTFDLTGLPPTPAQVDEFINDDRGDAYPLLIERLLESPAYGEQWGRHWLDVARYSDTKGYVYGREETRFVHSVHYRDWVINSFNDDLPYDRFLMLQIAADQAAPDDPTAAAAMGFLTLGRRFLGVQPDIIDDRIDVVTRGTMGLTVACARCHDHKFDPIPTADYYSLYGVFQNTAEQMVPLPPKQTSLSIEELAAFNTELEKRQTALADRLAAVRTEFSQIARSRIAEYLQAQFELDKYPEQSFSQILGKDDLLPPTVRRWQKYLQQSEKRNDPVFSIWNRLAQLREDEFPQQALAAIDAIDDGSAAINPRVAAAFATAPESQAELVARYAGLFGEVDRQWKELTATAEAAKAPVPTSLPNAADEQLRHVIYGEASPCVIPNLPVINIEFDVDTGTCVALWKLQNAVDQWIVSNPLAAPQAIILQDRSSIMLPRIFRRGNPANQGDEVPLQFLQVIERDQRVPFAQGSGRLELAQAIASADNPLTARVWVNRVWAHHFGQGIVPTTSDFGTRAEPPSHPQLLDWLAQGFIRSGWSTKWLHRQMMLSAAYRQTSQGPTSQAAYAAARDTDPQNRLLWRMNARRLRFEELRDAALATAGQLDPKMGGKPVDLFASTDAGARRSIYAKIDRQSLPTVLQTFDFANPDLHTPKRSETTVPQQALFGLNHPFVADRARGLADALPSVETTTPADRIIQLFTATLQRQPSESELAAAIAYIGQNEPSSADKLAMEAIDSWTYGYGTIDPENGKLTGFTPLPYFTGTAWQGSTSYPDSKIGWAQITADGGHPGNDLQHAIVRRWTAPQTGTFAIESHLQHVEAAGDGVRCWVLTESETLRKEVIHNAKLDINIDSVQLKQGQTIDFVVDIYKVLNTDQHLWSQKITLTSSTPESALDLSGTAGTAESSAWISQRDFTGMVSQQLDRWQQLAQALLLSNEFMFVD